MASVTKYFRDSIEELRHVRWPTRQQAIRLSIIVIAFTVLCAAFFGFIDFALSNIIKFILSAL
jgi:preprotein translocase subunit SecE